MMKWWQKTIVYEIYPASFQDSNGDGIGDIKGIISRLDYLKSLGVGALWLTPIYVSPMVDNGYDVADYYNINPMFGTMEDIEGLIREAAERDIKIVMDLVFNHTSDQNAWFLESKSSRNNPKADWYIWRDAKPDGKEPTNWRAIFGGSVWEWCEERGQYYLHSFAKGQPDLNWENPQVRQELFRIVRFWINKGVGGFRMDAMPFINKPGVYKDGEPDAYDGMVSMMTVSLNADGDMFTYLKELKEQAFSGNDIFAVVEADGIKAEDLKYWVGKNGAFDMLIEFNHVKLALKKGGVWTSPNPWKLTELKEALTASQKATKNDGWVPLYFENHDNPRSVNQYFPGCFTRGKNETLSGCAAKALAAVLMTLRGTPFLYQGEELGLKNVYWDSIEMYNDIAAHGQYDFMMKKGWKKEDAMEVISEFSRDNARTPMQWDGTENSGFTKGKPWLPVHEDYEMVNAAAEDLDENSVLNWYRKLAKLRRANEDILCGGDYTELLSESEKIYAFRRKAAGGCITVLVNFSGEAAGYDPLVLGLADAVLLCSSYKESIKGSLQPYEAVIYKG